MTARPAHYPMTANSGIADAERFSFNTVPEDGGKMHIPARFPDGNKVVAKCGAYGWATERDARLIHWASGDLAGEYDCPTCAERA